MSLSTMSSETSFEVVPSTEDLSSTSNVASKGSTPPTSVTDADNISQSSDLPKLDAINMQVATPPDAAIDVATATSIEIPAATVDDSTPATLATATSIEIPAAAVDNNTTPATLQPQEATPSVPPQRSTPTPTPAATPPSNRPKRARTAAPIYNLSKLSGTDVHGKRRSKGDIILTDKKRRRTTGATPGEDTASDAHTPNTRRKNARSVVQDGIDALDLQWSIPGLKTPRTRRMAKSLSPPKSAARGSRPAAKSASFSRKVTKLGKQTRQAADATVTRMTRELRRLRDTNEFSHIDTQPIFNTVWSNGKEIQVDASGEPVNKKPRGWARKKAVPDASEEESPAPLPPPSRRSLKKYLEKGLYAGQPTPSDWKEGLNTAEKRRLSQIPDLKDAPRPNKVLPFPMFNGLRTLIKGRDYKLPYNICNPLPPGQPKPDEWRKMTKNRFIGDSRDYWRKTPHLNNDFTSKCVCEPEDGCGESCQNRIMLYECDTTNCNVGPGHCTNRAFAQLAERRAGGGRYRIGVEVFKTPDRGYGVRSNRCFEPHQIITEYTGEIITEEECDRRMEEKYKNNACYYLMSFDQNMIIDATTGSIARFVNHSCNPNCRMIKWIVGGNPRMALFAGDRPIMTGDELTYDYKFDPFSAKNVQVCFCREDNCRGVLGPKRKEEKKTKEASPAKGKGKGPGKKGKRKLDDISGADETVGKSPKKRKMAAAKGLKRTLSAASLKAAKGAKGAAAMVKKVKGAVKVKSRAGAGRSPARTPTKRMVVAKGGGRGTPLKSARKSPASKALGKGRTMSGKRSPRGGAAATTATTKVSRKSATGGVAKATKKHLKAAVTTKTTTTRVYDTYSLNNLAASTTTTTTAKSPPGSGRKRSSSMTIVVTDENADRVSPISKSGRVRKLTEKATEMAVSPKGRKALEISRSATKIRIVEADD